MQTIRFFIAKIFSKLLSEVKKMSISQALLVMFLTVFFLSIAAYFKPQYFSRFYYDVDISEIKIYFDFYVRNGWFKVPYFVFVALLVAFIGQLFCIQGLKKQYPLGARLNIGFLALGLLVSLGMYYVMPYYTPDFSSYDLDRYELKTEMNEEGTAETAADFCGKRIDFFFSPYEGYSIKGFQVVKELEGKIAVPVNYQCIASGLNEDRACRANHGVSYDPEMEELLGSWLTDKGRPTLVLGCKYAYRGLYTVDAYQKAICEKLGEGCE